MGMMVVFMAFLDLGLNHERNIGQLRKLHMVLLMVIT